MKKKNIIKSMILIALFVIIILIYRNFPRGEYLFESKDVEIIENWTYDNKILTSNKLKIEPNEIYTVESNFPMKANQYLLLRSSLSNLQVIVDDVSIYDVHFDYEGVFHQPLASLWHLVKLPKDGENIKVTYQTPFKKMSGLVNPVAYGHRGDLLFYIFGLYGLPFIIDGLILFFGVLMIIISFINTQKINNANLQIGILAILVALWLISESKMLQFFSGSPLILGSLPYLSLALIPIPIIMYIKNFVSEETKKPFKITKYICIINFFVIVFLQIFGIQYFFETLWISHGFMVVLLLITIKQLYFEVRVKRNKLAKHFLIALSILFLFCTIDLYRFHTLDGSNFTLFVRLGLLIFILLLGLETSRQLVTLLKQSYKAIFYEQLAYLDQLTQGPNRTAFEKDLNAIFNDEKALPNLRLVILDLNQLKNINDHFGHVTGDEAIKTSYILIEKHFRNLGKTYRIGGDEFACIITKNHEEDFNKSCIMLNDHISEMNKNLHYPIGIALGSVTYDPLLDTTLKKMMHRADINMYEAKKKYKALWA